jgi:hypothetical protein
MKTMTLLVLSVFFVNLICAQEQALKITNHTSGKEILLKEHKRIKIKTVAGQKISGRFSVENSQVITINNAQVALTDIAEIKRNPLLISVFTSSLLIYAGAITAGMAAIIAATIDTTAIWLVIPAAGLVYAGIKSPNFYRKFTPGGGWTFAIITTSP